VDEVDISTVVRVPPGEAFEFLLDFPGYAAYTDHLEDVRRDGDGGVGTAYEFVLSYWVISYTARSRVTDIDPPNRIDWTLDDAFDAQGAWFVEPVDAEEAAEAVDVGDGTDADAAEGDANDAETEVAEAERSVDPDGECTAEGEAAASRIRLQATFDRESVTGSGMGIPRFISATSVFQKVAPVAKSEAEKILARIVADLEGEPRPIEVTVSERPEFLQ
jgi:hypothetical protein